MVCQKHIACVLTGVKFRAPCYLATSFRYVLRNLRLLERLFRYFITAMKCRAQEAQCTYTPSRTPSKETAEEFRQLAARKGYDTIMWRIEVTNTHGLRVLGVANAYCNVIKTIMHAH